MQLHTKNNRDAHVSCNFQFIKVNSSHIYAYMNYELYDTAQASFIVFLKSEKLSLRVGYVIKPTKEDMIYN